MSETRTNRPTSAELRRKAKDQFIGTYIGLCMFSSGSLAFITNAEKMQHGPRGIFVGGIAVAGVLLAASNGVKSMQLSHRADAVEQTEIMLEASTADQSATEAELLDTSD